MKGWNRGQEFKASQDVLPTFESRIRVWVDGGL